MRRREGFQNPKSNLLLWGFKNLRRKGGDLVGRGELEVMTGAIRQSGLVKEIFFHRKGTTRGQPKGENTSA